MLPQKTKAYSDVHLLQREFLNKNKFRVKFTRIKEFETYILKCGKNLGPQVAFVDPDQFIYLPHGYYNIEGVNKNGTPIPAGTPIEMLMNLEKAMFKGNRVPSNQYGFDQ